MKDTNTTQIPNTEEDVTYCDCCGAEITGDVVTFDGETLCEDCLDERTVVCSHCGERIWNDDNAGGSDVPLCERCYDHYYGFYRYASTNAILDRALLRLGIMRFEHEEIPTECGDILKIDNRGEITRSNFDIRRLNFWDYRYFMRYDWHDYNKPNEPAAVKQLKEFAEGIGVASQDIDLLLDYGYLVEEIEELLYHPGAFDEAVCELLGEYEYCLEDF